MQRSKHIAFSILMMAAIVLILNNARPHHHHHYQVCFSTEHCEDGEVCHSDGNAGEHGVDHQHSHPINELCKVNGFYIIPDTKSPSGKVQTRTSCKSLQLQGIIPVNYASNIKASARLYIDFSQLRSELSVKCLVRALRAPPSC